MLGSVLIAAGLCRNSEDQDDEELGFSLSQERGGYARFVPFIFMKFLRILERLIRAEGMTMRCLLS